MCRLVRSGEALAMSVSAQEAAASSAGPSWVRVTSARFQTRRTQLAVRGIGPERWMQAETLSAAKNKAEPHAGLRPPTAAEAAQQVFETVRTDLATTMLASDPWWWQYVINGRPVQETFWHDNRCVLRRMLYPLGWCICVAAHGLSWRVCLSCSVQRSSQHPSVSIFRRAPCRRRCFIVAVRVWSAVAEPHAGTISCVCCVLEALVLTHEDATIEEKLPYLAQRLQPLTILECFGRARTRHPPCPAEQAVFHWWKDTPRVYVALIVSWHCRVVHGQTMDFVGFWYCSRSRHCLRSSSLVTWSGFLCTLKRC